MLTVKQLHLLENLSAGPAHSYELVRGVVAPFRATAEITPGQPFQPQHVVGSMLKRLAKQGLCYNRRSTRKWHITELGVHRLLDEIQDYLNVQSRVS